MEKIKDLFNFNKTEKEDKNNGNYVPLSDSIIKSSSQYYTSNGIVATVLKLDVKPGSNRNLSFRSIINLLPKPSEDVKLTFIVKDSSIKGEEKQTIVNKNTFDNMEAKDIQSTQQSKRERNDTVAKAVQESEYADYADYQTEANSPRPLVLYEIYLIAEGSTQAKIETQITSINLLLDKVYPGLQFFAHPGKQLDMIQEIYKPLVPSKIHKTSTGNNYAVLNFAISRGLKDKSGIPIGLDTLSVTSNSTLFDFNKYTTNQAFIAIPSASVIRRYSRDTMDKNKIYTTSSYLAQAAANNIAAHNTDNKIFHIVLNNFQYADDPRYFMNEYNAGQLKTYDMTKLTINPLQGFGEYHEVQQVFERLTQKIVDIFDILLEYSLKSEERAVILDAIERFYFNQSLWSSETLKYPKRARIIKVKKPELYPTLSLFINEFTNLATKALSENREMKADRIDTLQSILRQALTAYQNVLGATTSIDFDPNYRQFYYQFNNIESPLMKQVQFLNIFEFIRYIAKPNDTIIIHGMNNLYEKTTEMAFEAIESAKRKDVKLIYTFDEVTSARKRLGEMTDMFKMNRLFYHDLNTDVDWSVVGTCTQDDVKKFEKSLRMPVGARIAAQMTQRSYSQVFIHRDRGHIDHFTSLDFLI